MKASEYDINMRRNLKRLRKERGLSQDDLAKELNMTKSNYSKIESGERKITTGQLIVIAQRIKVSPSELILLCNGEKGYWPKEKFSVQELFAKLILIKEGRREKISFNQTEEEFLKLVKKNYFSLKI